jgi:hypothetical protein
MRWTQVSTELSQRSPGLTIGAASAENAPVVVLNRPFPIFTSSGQQQTSSDLDDDKPANCSSNRCSSFCDVAYLIRASLIPKRRKRFWSRRRPDRMRFARNYRGPKSLSASLKPSARSTPEIARVRCVSEPCNTPSASTRLVRTCRYSPGRSWTIN